MMKVRHLLLALAAPALLAACQNPDLTMNTVMPPPADHVFMEPKVEKQMEGEASGRLRQRDLRAEVVGSIAYLREHLGEDRAMILDMQDDLLVTMNGPALFNGRTANLTDEGIDMIARVAAAMKAFPHTRIAVAGHVTGSQSGYADQILSERRAVAVKSVLISRGIDACRIGAMGKGSEDKIGSAATDRSNQVNDRVEMKVRPYQDGACV